LAQQFYTGPLYCHSGVRAWSTWHTVSWNYL
jgi:hypothetical protein